MKDPAKDRCFRLFLLVFKVHFSLAFLPLGIHTSSLQPFRGPPSLLWNSEETKHANEISNNLIADGVANVALHTTAETIAQSPPTAVAVAPPIPASRFNLTTALFCAGLAFDSYIEPPANSSRWERGSRGCNVAFVSAAFTRTLYQGLLQVTVLRVTDLPEDTSAAERLVSGSGVDAAVWVAVVEGRWKEDVQMLTTEAHHEGVWSLTGAAHVGTSSTAWSNVDEKMSMLAKRQRGRANPYHIPATWTKGGQAVWPDPEVFYLYVQDPKTARLVFTVIDTDRLGRGKVIGSTWKLLPELIPQSRLSSEQVVSKVKEQILKKLDAGELGMEALDDITSIRLGAKSWRGVLPLKTKPRIPDKKGQMAAAAAAGALVGGPLGAAAGATLASFYEGEVRGRVELELRYLPIPQVPVQSKKYAYTGGMPGVDWSKMYKRFRNSGEDPFHDDDLEMCFFVNHDKTGGTCVVYRSLHQKLVVVSFRGTCRPVDLITDVTITQDPWVQGDDEKQQRGNDFNGIIKVHTGFRKSLDSIARRLKELLLAAVAPGHDWKDYDLLVTGHSLGGALATLFVADIAEYGLDAGRALPQVEPGEPWWKSITSVFFGNDKSEVKQSPPRPKSIRLYSFGSPRVGNRAFAQHFDNLIKEKKIMEAYRLVNGDDIVTRLPRTMNVLVFGSIDYEHVGPTVLLTNPNNRTEGVPLLWIEGESDNQTCPVRDGEALATSSLLDGSFFAQLLEDDSFIEETQASDDDNKNKNNQWEQLTMVANKLSQRIMALKPTDVASLLGIDRNFSEREMKILNSLVQGQGLAHHLEDEYYTVMGGACGFLARIGEEIVELT